ncbi:MAG: hypothetical protein JWN00_197 [Actinomycetia bacterium]|jgi:hypothetical protein|nr:hypothetical protein [Actinomycetes bacterium]
MGRKRVIAGFAAAGMAGAVAGAVWAFGASGAQAQNQNTPTPDPGQAVVHTVTEKPSDVIKYWTPDRIRNAKPADMPTPYKSGG